MPDPASNADLMRSLGRLVRGLSALFWGLPATLVICFHTAKADSLKTFGILPPLAVTGLLVYGLWQLTAFQKQERVWQKALDRALLFGLMVCGLSPFLYWSNRVPGNLFFYVAVLVMAAGSLCFLGSLNQVLRRLGDMLPDETLRHETRQFTALNINLLWITFVLTVLYHSLGRWHTRPLYLDAVMLVLERGSFWFLVLLVLLPLAMTMALLWKTKEVILDSVFQARR